ncbi:MAG TPA: hypothetical protein VEH77_15175 [Roseiarcus sp.]|nr:hypothetical protein [Roseiarcus sp.]
MAIVAPPQAAPAFETETAAATVARFRTVDALINKGDPEKRQLRKLPAPEYVISRLRAAAFSRRGRRMFANHNSRLGETARTIPFAPRKWFSAELTFGSITFSAFS